MMTPTNSHGATRDSISWADLWTGAFSSAPYLGGREGRAFFVSSGLDTNPTAKALGWKSVCPPTDESVGWYRCC
jgi:hypothetical protein